MFSILSPGPVRLLGVATAGIALSPGGWAQGLNLSIFQRYQSLDGALHQASLEVDGRNFGRARQLLEPCLRQIPDHFEAHFLLARIAYEGRDYDGTLAHLGIAGQSLAKLDRLYREEIAALKALADAEQQAMQSSLDNLYARGVDPNGCQASLFLTKRQALAFLEAKKGHLYDRENPFAVPADYRFLQGNALLRLGRREEARVQYRAATAADPAHANAWNNLIALSVEARDLAQARTDLGRAEAAGITVRPALRRVVLGGEAAAGGPP